MSISLSPNIITNGLIFHFDQYNTVKSWLGAPTTNILPSPSVNGRFTTDNSWGTYNTNQYNGANYFSIGTISSVTNNIVTTSGNHPLRTYDVVTPQTSGGGVTAGTNYFVKKINNTQFSLHDYNSSQNGSQGYFISSFHKVHENIASDNRLSINATSFPTMWWGPPHLPNSGLVKEIVPNVGPTGQNVMRLHVHRTDGVADGMAYGVYTPVTAGDVINVSYWLRTNYPGKNLGYSTYFGASSAYSNGTSATKSWQRVKFQWTASATYSFYQYWWPDGSTDIPYYFDICDLQVEVNTGAVGSTPFVAGTRSNTQAVLDLTNTNTITASSLTYANDGTFSFNGSSSRLQIPISGNPSMYCMDIAIKNYKAISPNTGMGPYYSAIGFTANGYSTIGLNLGEWTGSLSNETLSFWHNGSAQGAVSIQDTIDANWNIYSINWNGSSYDIWVNGTKRTISSSFGTVNLITNLTKISVGYNEGWNYWFNGSIGAMKIYNRQLTDIEVQQNFAALRGRYGV